IEDAFAERLAEHVDRLALHSTRGEVWDKALVYCRQAGDKAASRAAYREAIDRFDDALGAITHLPESVHAAQATLDLRLALRNALMPLGELDRLLECLQEAEAIAHDLSDRRRLAQVSGFMSQTHYWLGHHGLGIGAGLRARGLGVLLNDASVLVVGRYRV